MRQTSENRAGIQLDLQLDHKTSVKTYENKIPQTEKIYWQPIRDKNALINDQTFLRRKMVNLSQILEGKK
jgi:hypothetical protein